MQTILRLALPAFGKAPCFQNELKRVDCKAKAKHGTPWHGLVRNLTQLNRAEWNEMVRNVLEMNGSECNGMEWKLSTGALWQCNYNLQQNTANAP